MTSAGKLQLIMDLLNPYYYDEETDSLVCRAPLISVEDALKLLEFKEKE